jgi:nicotinamide riboside transporter PnuC
MAERMAISERIYKVTDRPMTWTKAIVLGLVIWTLAILILGQLPSWIIYWFDAEVTRIIDWSKLVPFVGEDGLNPRQVEMVRDLVANGVQMTFFIAALIGAYYWQKVKQRRTGAKGLQDPVKGYLSGK